MLYRAVFDHALRRTDAEWIHEQVFRGLGAASRLPLPLLPGVPHRPRTVMGLTFPHAFGLAAGFDKNARAVLPLLALGFGHVEIGTVTAHAQPGNPRPRLHRLVDDRAIVNRMGFNNDGAAAVAPRLATLRRDRRGRDAVIGVNLGKSKVTPAADAAADYATSTRLLAPYASYLVVNVSSPNTPGLRDLQATASLAPIVTAVRAAADEVCGHRPPLLVKIAPDLADADVDAVTDLAVELGVDGLIATNTTIARPESLRTDRARVEAAGGGGLSGPPVAPRSRAVVRRVRARAGERLAIVAVGGVTTPADVNDRLADGADLVQGYTGLVYEGPAWPRRLARACP